MTSYIFGKFIGGYTQYPVDSQSNVFQQVIANAKAETQVVIHRDGNLMYYCYLRKFEVDNCIGFCVLLNGTYVEISITEQRMWFYKNGSLLVDTPVVTGNPNTGHGTPAGGVWKLKDKRAPFTLTGYKEDGSIDYEEPVNYWMPFNGGVGIHDLTKRAAFGGDIYLTNGSHGCVNTPLEAVATIYNNIDINTPVVVY